MITGEQAKDILRVQRPAVREGEDPEVREALHTVEQDPGLRVWWGEHQGKDASIRAALREISVPAGLADRICAGRPRKIVPFPSGRRWLWAAAAMVALTISVWIVWLERTPIDEFSAYRNRMARAAVREYRMSLTTNDLGVIQQYLAKQQAPTGYRLAPAVAALPSLGCGVVRWQNHPVSMLCFDLGKQELLWLFVADVKAVRGAPKSAQPAVASVGRLATAAWSDGRLVYVLAVIGDRRQLERFL
jgi:hypothetical protein